MTETRPYCPCGHPFKAHSLNGYPVTGDYCKTCKAYCELVQWEGDWHVTYWATAIAQARGGEKVQGG